MAGTTSTKFRVHGDYGGDSPGLVTSIAPFRVNLTGTPVVRWMHGRCVLVAGTCTVSNSTITAASDIFVNRQVDAGTVGAGYSITRTAGTSFTITARDGAGVAQGADTSTVGYQIIEP